MKHSNSGPQTLVNPSREVAKHFNARTHVAHGYDDVERVAKLNRQ